jgi:hypothetical protein
VVETAGHSLGQLVQDSKRGAPKVRTAEGRIARSQYIEDRPVEMLEGRGGGGRATRVVKGGMRMP